jgi:hypothetical protein
MAYHEVKITFFEPVEDGYLFAFAAGSVSLAAVLRAIVALDPWQRRWLPAERAWWIADDAITLLARRLPALADLLCQWHVRRNDISQCLEGGYWARCAATSTHGRAKVYVPRAVEAAYGSLRLPPGAGAEEVAAARRALAREHHPDTGGQHTSMAAINVAADTVMEWLKQPR